MDESEGLMMAIPKKKPVEEVENDENVLEQFTVNELFREISKRTGYTAKVVFSEFIECMRKDESAYKNEE
jgi:hypothetical protein